MRFIFYGSLPHHTGEIIYEDAEDGKTLGWAIYDNTPSGAIISNVLDGNLISQVIELTGSGKSNGYRKRLDNGSVWNNTTDRMIEWSMKYAEDFTVYIDCQTTAGHRYIYYTPIDNDNLGSGEYVHFGLGQKAKQGQWCTFMRNLQADLSKAQPGETITAVNGFLIRGSGFVDAIKMY